MTAHVIDFFKIGGDREVVATLVDDALQDSATPEFLALWRRRPRELTYRVGGPEPGYLCVLRSYPVTLEDEPSRYIAALDEWLFDYGYTLQGRRGRE